MNENSALPNEETLRIDFDGKWKMIIEKLFEYFILFFVEELHSLIDFNHSPTFLKQELPKLAPDKFKEGDMINDIFAKVKLKKGDKHYLLFHAEVHGYENIDFGRKMFKYFTRIMDYFGLSEYDITAFALLLGNKLPKNPGHFYYKLGRTEVSYKFPTYAVREQDEEKLLASKNPFAIAVLACLHINNTRKNLEERFNLKFQLFRLILSRYNRSNQQREIAIILINFVNNVMVLPDVLEEKYMAKTYEFIKKSSGMNQFSEITAIDKKFANTVTLAMYGESIDDLLSRLEKEHQLREEEEAKRKEEEAKRKEEEAKRKEEEAKRKEEEAKRKEEEAKRKEEEAKRKEEEALNREERKKTILLLHQKFNQSPQQITESMGFPLNFVEETIKNINNDV